MRAGDHVVNVTSEPSAYPLLSEQSAKQLHLIQYNDSFLVKHVTEPELPAAKRLIAANLELFSGKIGRAKTGEVSLMIDDTVKPVVQKQRRVTFHLSDLAESKMKELLSHARYHRTIP